MFGLSFDKLVIIGFIAVALIGPKRLPLYAAQLAKWVKVARDLANGAKTRLGKELGPEFEDIDWKRLDPRQYDPRRIVMNALTADDDPTPTVRPPAGETTNAADAESPSLGGPPRHPRPNQGEDLCSPAA